MPDFRYRQTTATLDVHGFEFRATGRQPIDLGWRAAFPEWQPADEKGDDAQLLPPLRNGETAQLQDPKVENKADDCGAQVGFLRNPISIIPGDWGLGKLRFGLSADPSARRVGASSLPKPIGWDRVPVRPTVILGISAQGRL